MREFCSVTAAPRLRAELGVSVFCPLLHYAGGNAHFVGVGFQLFYRICDGFTILLG